MPDRVSKKTSVPAGFDRWVRISLLLATVGAIASVVALFIPPNNIARMTLFGVGYLGGLAVFGVGYAYATLRWRFAWAVHLLGLVPPLGIAVVRLGIHILGPKQIGIIFVVLRVVSWMIFAVIAILAVVALTGWIAWWRDR